MVFANNVILYNDNCLNVVRLEEVKNKNMIIVTDPPFNIGYHYNEYSDKMDYDDYYNMLIKLFENRKFVIIHYPESIYSLAVRMRLIPDRVVSWVYNSNTPRQHRDIAYFGFSPDFNLVKQPYKNPKDKRIMKRIAQGKDCCKMYDWIEVNQIKNVSKDKTEHPCQMPQDVMDSVIGIIPREDIYIYMILLWEVEAQV